MIDVTGFSALSCGVFTNWAEYLCPREESKPLNIYLLSSVSKSNSDFGADVEITFVDLAVELIMFCTHCVMAGIWEATPSRIFANLFFLCRVGPKAKTMDGAPATRLHVSLLFCACLILLSGTEILHMNTNAKGRPGRETF